MSRSFAISVVNAVVIAAAVLDVVTYAPSDTAEAEEDTFATVNVPFEVRDHLSEESPVVRPRKTTSVALGSSM